MTTITSSGFYNNNYNCSQQQSHPSVSKTRKHTSSSSTSRNKSGCLITGSGHNYQSHNKYKLSSVSELENDRINNSSIPLSLSPHSTNIAVDSTAGGVQTGAVGAGSTSNSSSTNTPKKKHNYPRKMAATIGQSVNLAIEQFVTIGEVIADDYADVKLTMHTSCKDARDAGILIEQLCLDNEKEQLEPHPNNDELLFERRLDFIQTTKLLLTAVTRILLLADMVVVKQLVSSKDRVNLSMGRLEAVSNFTEFVKAFTQFGNEMIELAVLTGERQNDLLNERHRAQMAVARQSLDRCTVLLLTSSKLCLKFPECVTGRENRDTVFNQMRKAIDLINFVVKYGLILSDEQFLQYQKIDNAQHESISSKIINLKQFLELSKMSLETNCLDNLQLTLDTIIEYSQDFTDSAYVLHDYRENILLLGDRLKVEVNRFIDFLASLIPFDMCSYSHEDLQKAIDVVRDAIDDLVDEIVETALQQVSQINRLWKICSEAINLLRLHALDSSDKDVLHNQIRNFYDLNDHFIEICKLLHHVASTECSKVYAKSTEYNFRVFGPQVISAVKTVSIYPESKLVLENFETFIDMYQLLLTDLKKIAAEFEEKHSKNVQLMLGAGGGSSSGGSTSLTTTKKRVGGKRTKSVRLDASASGSASGSSTDTKIKSSVAVSNTIKMDEESAHHGQSDSLTNNQCDNVESCDDDDVNEDNDNDDDNEDDGVETDIDPETLENPDNTVALTNAADPTNVATDAPQPPATDNNNEILRRAKNMTDMAYAMFDFTRGDGPLKTTQDLFTQAEFYAEEANRLYKVIRLFSYQVPGGETKKLFLDLIDQVPSLVQRLQFIVKEHTVGKVATFTKVDKVICETKQLMSTIAKVVNCCLECAKKYNIELNDGIFVNNRYGTNYGAAGGAGNENLSNSGSFSGSNSNATSGSRSGSDGHL